jgi:hypothetical protein
MINHPCDERFANRSLDWPDGRRATVDGGSKPADPDGAANPIEVQDLVSRTTVFDGARGRLGIHFAFPRPARGTVRTASLTILDVTKPGFDKAFGIKRLRDILGIATDEMVFIGDALFPGGNDYPAEQAGVGSIRVRDPDETNMGYRSNHCLFRLHRTSVTL